jgi:NAD(P)-dependent dehydrogenase (short-subunit alcohol dehydrogenase family)
VGVFFWHCEMHAEDYPVTSTPSDAGERPAIGTSHNRLRGKTALVTGSTRGLGRTAAEWLARDGANVYVTGRGQADVDEAVAAIRTLGVEAWGAPADLSRVEDIHALAERALDEAGPFDILVNNAGMSISQSFMDVSDDQWDYQMNVNVRAPFILSQHMAKAMIANGIRGRIVNVSTIGVFAGHRERMVYNMAKAGVQTMTRNMSYELGRHRISVNCIAPGNVAERPGTEGKYGEADEARWAEWIPFGRVGRAEDIAAAVVFFCLPETEWTTGQTLLVDGGHNSYLTES